MDIFHFQNRWNQFIWFVLMIRSHQKIYGIVSMFFLLIFGVKLQNYICSPYSGRILGFSSAQIILDPSKSVPKWSAWEALQKKCHEIFSEKNHNASFLTLSVTDTSYRIFTVKHEKGVVADFASVGHPSPDHNDYITELFIILSVRIF